jgi:hypothetical protein
MIVTTQRVREPFSRMTVCVVTKIFFEGARKVS